MTFEGYKGPVTINRLMYFDDAGILKSVKVDSDDGSLHTFNWIWNTDTLAWERMKQPVFEVEGDLTVTMGDVEKLLASAYWLNVKYDYDASGNCIYKGLNTDVSAGDGDTDWYIIKYDYTSGNCTQKRVKVTSWTLRAGGW